MLPAANSRFRTPQDTVTFWVKAVNGCRWGEEYECYTGDQQAKFTLQVIISTHELSDSRELSDELHRILESYRFPMRALDEYPSLRRDLSQFRDDSEIQKAINQQNEKRQLQLARWKQDIQPLAIDWARMMDALHPLLTKTYKRHLHELHPSSTGIVHHLNYHRFVRESIDEIDGTVAHGSVVPVIRDAKSMVNDDRFGQESTKLQSLLDHARWILRIRKRHGERSPEKIRLVKVDEGWKLDTVPFR